MSRPGWDEYFMGIARAVAVRSTCDRKSVGCVLARGNVLLTTGYNGAPRGLPHCDDVGHDLEHGSCQRVVHAEHNAVAQAARDGRAVGGATAYVTSSPCWHCFRLLAQAGVARVVFAEAFYRDGDKIALAALELGIALEQLAGA
jgi:dCMP deaminase